MKTDKPGVEYRWPFPTGSQMNDEVNVKPAFRWSFSQWETYHQCPFKWKCGSVLKLPRKPPGPAAARGSNVHDTVEKYIQGEPVVILHDAVHPKYIPILDEFKYHHNGDRHTEKKLAFDVDWSICDPKSKFASCVAVLDAVRYTKGPTVPGEDPPLGELDIGEWKSGKPKDTHADQRSLYAMIGMRYWYADIVRVTTYYLEDTLPPQRTTLNSEEGFNRLKTIWMSRIETMQRDQMCSPRPGFYCRFCDFSKSAGGPCVYT